MIQGKNDITVVILTGGKMSEELSSVFGDLPSGMAPVNNRPAIYWTLDKFIKDGFSNFVICIGFKRKQIETFVKHNFSDRAKIKFKKVDVNKKPGSSFISSLEEVRTDKMLLILGDTLIYDSINYVGDFILTSSDFRMEESYRWALIQNKNGYLERIFDKEKKIVDKMDPKKLSLIIGVYFFSNVTFLKKISSSLKSHDIEISKILHLYNRKVPIRIVPYENWLDFGHLDRYYSSAKKFLQYQSRYFNSLEYDDLLGTITKRSKNKIKFRNEINWYFSLPKKLKPLAPRVLDWNKNSTDSYLTLEYYGYPTLAELFVFGNLNPYVWKNIIDRGIRILKLFYGYKGKVTRKDYESIYWDKLKKRINQLKSDNFIFGNILDFKRILINGKSYKNLSMLEKKIRCKIKKLYSENDNCFIHGDFCFSNILYDAKNGVLRVIDPRGLWGSTCYGDIKYDVAKLRHSIVGEYDFITNNLFTIRVQKNKIQYKIFHNHKLHKSLSEYFDFKVNGHWDVEKIKFIEGLLFLSMLPLHKDYPERQLIMFAIGIKRINETLKGI